MDADARDGAGGEVDARRPVHRHADRAALIHRFDDLGRRFLGRAGRTGPQDPIEEDGGRGEGALGGVGGHERYVPAVGEGGVGGTAAGLHGDHFAPPAAQRAQRDVSVAAVVTAPHRGDDPSFGQKVLDDLGDRAARVLHQQTLGDAVLLAGAPIDLGHLGRRRQREPFDSVQLAHTITTRRFQRSPPEERR